MFDNGIVNKSIQTYLIKKKNLFIFKAVCHVATHFPKIKHFEKKNQSAIFGPVPLRKHIYKYNVYY